MLKRLYSTFSIIRTLEFERISIPRVCSSLLYNYLISNAWIKIFMMMLNKWSRKAKNRTNDTPLITYLAASWTLRLCPRRFGSTAHISFLSPSSSLITKNKQTISYNFLFFYMSVSSNYRNAPRWKCTEIFFFSSVTRHVTSVTKSRTLCDNFKQIKENEWYFKGIARLLRKGTFEMKYFDMFSWL